MKYEIAGHRKLSEADGNAGVRGDFTIRLTTKSVYLYPEPIRVVLSLLLLCLIGLFKTKKFTDLVYKSL